jgi:oxysterol-binding protein-related protein 9/10/11
VLNVVTLSSRFVPRYFEKNIESGIPILTAQGRKAVEEEYRESSSYCIEGETGPLAP